ncbi:MAG: hypothetical protein EOO70_06895 [Myxococcaceae bacterium]|nr:MAG: hypothetical protein EOO70_06895 [Myxococcaceae bacterium]
MSRGNEGRDGQTGRSGPDGDRDRPGVRNSRTSVRMTVERARAIQTRADRTGAQQDFKARAISAAARNAEAPIDGDE